MTAASLRSIPRPCLAWLVWFSLLFPVAQAAAAMHGVSHLAQDAGRGLDSGYAHQVHCDLCLLALAMGGGAPLGDAAAPAHPPVRHTAPLAAPATLASVAPTHPYRSRAPPPALH